MTTQKIIETIENKDFSSFLDAWTNVKDGLTEADKQKLLAEILENNYSESDFGFYVRVLDEIIDSKVSLDFIVDHWAPTFLSLAVYRTSRQLFDYLVRKGANINFIGDSYAFETEEAIKREVGENGFERYATCLDFAETKLADALTTDYNYSVPEEIENYGAWLDFDRNEEITIKKQDYYYLLEQSLYLRDLIHTDRLVDHIKSLGGKTYEQLNKMEKDLLTSRSKLYGNIAKKGSP